MKKLLFISSGVLFFFVVILGSNYIYFDRGGKTQTGQISGQADSAFIAETVAGSDYLEFFFTPKTESTRDYYVSYVLREGNDIIDSAENELKRLISKNNPIFLSLNRKPELVYSLEMKISDNENNNYLHNDKIVIQPAYIKNRN